MARGKGLQQKLELTEEMADFMGKDTASRAEITKKLWAHIKKHKLQNPENKQVIDPDEVLEALFGGKSFTMFQMAKKVSEHVFKPEE